MAVADWPIGVCTRNLEAVPQIAKALDYFCRLFSVSVILESEDKAGQFERKMKGNTPTLRLQLRHDLLVLKRK